MKTRPILKVQALKTLTIFYKVDGAEYHTKTWKLKSEWFPLEL